MDGFIKPTEIGRQAQATGEEDSPGNNPTPHMWAIYGD